MFGFGMGTLVDLGKALLAGETNGLEAIILKKLENAGVDLLKDFIPDYDSSVKVGERAEKLFKSGGASEFNRIRNHWFKPEKPKPLPGTSTVMRMQNAVMKNQHLITRPEGPWQKWSKSRQEWLDQSWKHDWRSQPRDYFGRWKAGRLRHFYISKGARRIRQQRRAAARKVVRDAFMRNQ